VSGEIEGLEGVTGNMVAADERMRVGAVQGLLTASRNTLNVSNRQVPHEEGDLERDGTISADANELIAAVAYGHDPLQGIKAVVQHEDMSLKHDSGRNAKFLENALNATAPQNGEIIATAIRGSMGT
jgi:hypothetical protein